VAYTIVLPISAVGVVIERISREGGDERPLSVKVNFTEVGVIIVTVATVGVCYFVPHLLGLIPPL
jgi:hypothetical protein